MLSVADTVWFQKENFETNEYSKEPWEKYIIKISFLKAFLTEEYEAMIGAEIFIFLKRMMKEIIILMKELCVSMMIVMEYMRYR